MKSGNKTLARDFTLKFLFHLRLDARPDFLSELTQSETPLSLLEQEWNDFDVSYTETDIEHPNNKLAQESYSFAKAIINSVLSNYESFKTKVSEHLKTRSIDKIDQMDFWILMMATSELHQSDDTPNKVVINEAIELAKKYGDNDSYAFVNGVLDSMSKTLN